MKTKGSGAGGKFMKRRAPEPELCQFYKGSAGSFHAKWANGLHQVFCISMKFGTLVDVTEKLRM